MLRLLRVGFAGAIEYPKNGGDHHELVFRDDANRQRLLEPLGGVCGKSNWQAWTSRIVRFARIASCRATHPGQIAGCVACTGHRSGVFRAKAPEGWALAAFVRLPRNYGVPSTTWRSTDGPRASRSVVDCGAPAPLWLLRRRELLGFEEIMQRSTKPPSLSSSSRS